MVEELFRQRLPGIGWVALERWPAGIKLRIRGYYVYEQSEPRPKPTLAFIDGSGKR